MEDAIDRITLTTFCILIGSLVNLISCKVVGGLTTSVVSRVRFTFNDDYKVGILGVGNNEFWGSSSASSRFAGCFQKPLNAFNIAFLFFDLNGVSRGVILQFP